MYWSCLENVTAGATGAGGGGVCFSRARSTIPSTSRASNGAGGCARLGLDGSGAGGGVAGGTGGVGGVPGAGGTGGTGGVGVGAGGGAPGSIGVAASGSGSSSTGAAPRPKKVLAAPSTNCFFSALSSSTVGAAALIGFDLRLVLLGDTESCRSSSSGSVQGKLWPVVLPEQPKSRSCLGRRVHSSL